jgi:glycosyltransferase involved in cell wall biosynthesis
VRDRTAVVIPAYNAAATVARVVAEAARFVGPERVIVVDDGSRDGTAEAARRAGAVVVCHEENRGKGAAIVTGAREARRRGMDWMVTLDADGQHDPMEIPKFWEAQRRTGAAIVLGNRMDNPVGMPRLRRFSNRVTSWIISWRVGQRLPDTQNGFRLLSVDLVLSLPLVTRRYETESEILIRALHRGVRVASVPVKSIYGDEPSSIHPWRDTWRFLWLVLRSFFW